MITCIYFKEFDKGTLKGFANFSLKKMGMEFFGFTFHEKDGKQWIKFPSKEYEQEGTKKYAPYFRFIEKNHYNEFQRQALEAIKNYREEKTFTLKKSWK